MNHDITNWVFAGNEGDICKPYKHLRYGAGNKWIEKYDTQGNIEITNDYFGHDPNQI